MQKVLTAEEMREVDRLTVEKYGIPYLILMENAAQAAARIIAEKLGGSVANKNFLILCGKGNNGGDGAALARILWTQGANVDVYLFGKIEETEGEARTNFEILDKITKGESATNESRLFFEEQTDLTQLLSNICQIYNVIKSFDGLIDAFFGTGLTRPLDESFSHFFKSIQNVCFYQKPLPLLVSLDIPSGFDSNKSVQIGDHFSADLTVTFTAPKPANVLPPASRYNGELVAVNIGSPQELIDNSPSQLFFAEKRDAQDLLANTRFIVGSYKKTRGHVLVVAGSKNMSGAAALCANAAMTSGVGLVTVATPESARNIVAAHALPEIMVSATAETENGAIGETAFETVLRLSEKTDVAVIGCGLSSNEESTRKFVRNFVENRKTPIVIDADGLNALAPFDITGNDESPLVLTPHIGEMKRLSGVDESFDFSDRVSIIREFAQKHHVILVLKGERTLIAEPGGKVVVNPTGNAGLGKGGNGDTLAGIIGSFVAQSLAAPKDLTSYTPTTSPWQIHAAFKAVVVALYVAGLAGDIAAKKIGMHAMLASDVRDFLAEAFCELENE